MVKKVDQKSTVPPPDASACVPPEKPSKSTLPTPGGGPEFIPFKLDVEALQGIDLSRPPKFPVGTTVPERVYRAIHSSGSGISQFIEDAITGFNGDMRALINAAGQLDAERKSARFDTGVRSISGRVSKAALTRLQEIFAALEGMRGMSLAKILGGLVILHLSNQLSP